MRLNLVMTRDPSDRESGAVATSAFNRDSGDLRLRGLAAHHDPTHDPLAVLRTEVLTGAKDLVIA
jgi:hypothetical protein